jgi:hypothetical protein
MVRRLPGLHISLPGLLCGVGEISALGSNVASTSNLAVVLNTVTDDLALICSTSNGLRKHGAIAALGARLRIQNRRCDQSFVIFREGQIHALPEVNRPQRAN